jgi:hypothetical protein
MIEQILAAKIKDLVKDLAKQGLEKGAIQWEIKEGEIYIIRNVFIKNGFSEIGRENLTLTKFITT